MPKIMNTGIYAVAAALGPTTPMAASLLTEHYVKKGSKFFLKPEQLAEVFEALGTSKGELRASLIAIRCTVDLLLQEPAAENGELHVVKAQLHNLTEDDGSLLTTKERTFVWGWIYRVRKVMGEPKAYPDHRAWMDAVLLSEQREELKSISREMNAIIGEVVKTEKKTRSGVFDIYEMAPHKEG